MSNLNTSYNEDNIRSLDWKEHIRLRPGLYIGKLDDSRRWNLHPNKRSNR